MLMCQEQIQTTLQPASIHCVPTGSSRSRTQSEGDRTFTCSAQRGWQGRDSAQLRTAANIIALQRTNAGIEGWGRLEVKGREETVLFSKSQILNHTTWAQLRQAEQELLKLTPEW